MKKIVNTIPIPCAGYVVPFLENVTAQVSIRTLMAIAVERCYVIWRPLEARCATVLLGERQKPHYGIWNFAGDTGVRKYIIPAI